VKLWLARSRGSWARCSYASSVTFALDASARDRVRRALRVAAVVLLVVLSVGGIPGAPARPRTYYLLPAVADDKRDRDGTVDVTVRSIEDGSASSPIAGAYVRALTIVGDRAYRAGERDSDGRGRARLSSLPRGETWILVDAPGRARGSAHLALDAAPRSIAIDLAPGHVLDVLVRDELGAPMPQAEIEVLASSDPLPIGSRTGQDGRAHVDRLGVGPWRVAARVPGYEETTARASHDGEESVLVLHKLGAIAIHVLGPDDLPAAGAKVAVAGAALWPPRMASTDDHGDLRMSGLQAGTYALRATRDDTVSAIDFDVALARGDEKQVVLRLARGRFVDVRVTDGDALDAPGIAAARVTLAEGGLSPFPLEATSDRSGRARLGPIGPGAATLGVRAEGFVARGAVAAPDPRASEARVALVRAGVLTGRVLDARGEPIAGATIEIAGTDSMGGPIFDDPRRANFQAAHFDAMLSGPSPLVPAGELGVVPGSVPPIPNAVSARAFAQPSLPGTGASARDAEPWVTRADGTFRAAPASPGRVRAIVRHPQYVVGVSDLVTLAPGGDAHVDVVMREGGALEGRILDAHDRPIEGARVDVSGTRGTLERTTRTAGDGSFAFVALPDAITLTAGAPDADQPEVRMALAIPDGGRKEVTIVLPEPREALAVTVVDERGWPVDAAQVSASSLSPDELLRTTAFTDSHGEASLKRGRGLSLRVEVRAPAHAPRILNTDGTEDSLHIELSPAESATGEVVAERGRDAIVAATITLYTDLGVRRAQTDKQGTFALYELAPGAARLTVRAPGFAPLTKAITIPDSGGRRPFAIPRVEMQAEATVGGEVVDANGDPIAGARVAKDAVPTWLPVGSNPAAMATTDAQGRFSLHELPEGTVTLEAYAPGIGRARVGVTVEAGQATQSVRIVIPPGSDDESPVRELAASGSVAVTLGETTAPTEVVVVSVVEGSEAERAGIVPGDVLLSVDGARVAGMAEARAKLSGSIADDVVVAVRRADRTLALRVTREAIHR
jgi:hypothetical protein